MAPFYFLNVFTVTFLIGSCSSYHKVFRQREFNPCTSKTSCGECITAGPCAWCSDQDFNGAYRCDWDSNLYFRCTRPGFNYPSNLLQITTEKELGLKGTATEIVQISPQAQRLIIKPRNPLTTNMRFRQVEDYEIDVYFLMDMSLPTEDYTSNLANLADLLAENLPKLTSNFRLGFGFFVGLRSSVAEETSPINAAQFNHRMSLSTETPKFAKGVADLRGHVSEIPSSQTGLQATLSTIMQVILCQNEIGWRTYSNKLLIIASNSGLHYAEDSEPEREIPNSNFDRCHLNRSGMSSENFLRKNYTVEEVNRKLNVYKTRVLFAVTPDQLDVYMALSEQLEASDVGILAYDSSNIMDLVDSYYQRLSSDVRLRTNAPDNTRIKIYSRCLDGRRKERPVCKGLKIGDEVSFEIIIQVMSCPKDKRLWKDTITISKVDSRDSMVIDLELICSCPCEEPQFMEINSGKCDYAGTSQCGICHCNGTRFGRHCECDSREAINTCSRATDTVACSGRGQCVCGFCQCNPRTNPHEKYYGQFCECDNFSCNHGYGCNGQHGTCECGQCICEAGWKGNACECNDSDVTCMDVNVVSRREATLGPSENRNDRGDSFARLG